MSEETRHKPYYEYIDGTPAKMKSQAEQEAINARNALEKGPWPTMVREMKAVTNEPEKCGMCNGRGYTLAPDDYADICENCNGTGKIK